MFDMYKIEIRKINCTIAIINEYFNRINNFVILVCIRYTHVYLDYKNKIK